MKETYCKKRGCIVVRNIKVPRCELLFEDVKNSQLQKINYLRNVLRDEGNCDTEIWSSNRITKQASQRLNKWLGKSENSLETKKKVRKCYVMPILLNCREYWIISSLMKMKTWGNRRCGYSKRYWKYYGWFI